VVQYNLGGTMVNINDDMKQSLDINKSGYAIFDSIRQIENNGIEYWTARDLAKTLGYSEYRNIKSVVEKARLLCEQNGKISSNHFVEYNAMVDIGSGAVRKVKDYKLSRYACLLTVLNVSSKKSMTLAAIQYFSGKVRISNNTDLYQNTDLIFFSKPDGTMRVELIFDGDTVWTTQKRIAEIFEVDVRTVSYHINEIFKSGELNKYSVVQKNWITADDGKDYETSIYNLDVIIAVGYRVNSYKATHFRIWATAILSEYMRKGIVMDDERFKQGNKWAVEHFDEVLERIREIRASERMAYQKITDIYATADDYRKDDDITKGFYAKVQNKLHWAISGKTAAEIIYTSADAKKLHMGLNTWKQSPDGKVLKSDVAVAKNYLSQEHIKELDQLVSAYLDLAENRAKRHISTTMRQWALFLDNFLTLSSYPILTNNGIISAEMAKIKAFEEYEKFRVIQDKNYVSDFDTIIKRLNQDKEDNKNENK
jgi:hypothetical protein